MRSIASRCLLAGIIGSAVLTTTSLVLPSSAWAGSTTAVCKKATGSASGGVVSFHLSKCTRANTGGSGNGQIGGIQAVDWKNGGTTNTAISTIVSIGYSCPTGMSVEDFIGDILSSTGKASHLAGTFNLPLCVNLSTLTYGMGIGQKATY